MKRVLAIVALGVISLGAQTLRDPLAGRQRDTAVAAAGFGRIHFVDRDAKTVVVEHRLANGRPLYTEYSGNEQLLEAARLGACVAPGTPLAVGLRPRVTLRRFFRAFGDETDDRPPEFAAARVLEPSAERFRLPGGAAPVHPAGTLLRLAGKDQIYLVRPGSRLQPVEGADLPRLYVNGGFGGEQVILMGAAEFSRYTELRESMPLPLPGNGRPLPEGTLVRDASRRLALVTAAGTRRPFASLAVFEGLGYQFCNAVFLTETQLAEYPEEPIAIDGTPDGALLTPPAAELADDVTLLEEDELTRDVPIEGRTPLILIHGIHGNRHRGNDHIGDPNRDYFLRLLSLMDYDARRIRERFKVFRFHYVSDLKDNSVWKIGGSLRNHLDRALEEKRLADVPLVIVAHSMGGLVARAYMNQHSHNVGAFAGKRAGERVAQLVTMATPHHGSHLANHAARVNVWADPVWAGIFDLLDEAYWHVQNGCEPCEDNPAHENRSDLRWSNLVPPAFPEGDYSGEEQNEWLRSIPSDWNQKIIAYHGSIGGGEDVTELAGMGASALGFEIGKRGLLGDEHGALRAVGVLMERILLSLRERKQISEVEPLVVTNDGFVARESASYVGGGVGNRIFCMSHDHLDMLDGKRRNCENGKRLLNSVLEDAYAAAAPAATPELQSLAVEPGSVTGGTEAAAVVRISAAAPEGGIPITLTSSSTAARIPATATIPAGAAELRVKVETATVTVRTEVTLTARQGALSKTAALILQPRSGGGEAPVSLTVSANREILLAGAPEGRRLDDSVVPTNAPVSIPVQPGQVLLFSASGQIQLRTGGAAMGPAGLQSALISSNDSFGISWTYGPAGALLGVFLGSTAPSETLAPRGLDFQAGLRELTVLRPLLQQSFYIGDGKLPDGSTRQVVVPEGATRLFFAPLDYRGSAADNLGSFALTVTRASAPPPALWPRVPAATEIILAGAPTGRYVNDSSAPSASPVQAALAVLPGQALQFAPSGQVKMRSNGAALPPEGDLADMILGHGLFGISDIYGPRGALVGVFLGPEGPNGEQTPRGLDFSNGGREAQVLRPLLQQVFYIGNGKLPDGRTRLVITPDRATRLFLGVLNYRGFASEASGAFQASVNPVTGPLPVVWPFVPAIGAIHLAGAPAGRWIGDSSAPLNSPLAAEISIVPGQSIQITATGQITLGARGSRIGPEGDASSMISGFSAFGIAGIRGPAGALVGVFLGPNPPDDRATPNELDFSGDLRRQTLLQPRLQQVFLIGTGVTTGGEPRRIQVPAGATRLFLAPHEYRGDASDNAGGFTVQLR